MKQGVLRAGENVLSHFAKAQPRWWGPAKKWATTSKGEHGKTVERHLRGAASESP
jgi:hypothetical protein